MKREFLTFVASVTLAGCHSIGSPPVDAKSTAVRPCASTATDVAEINDSVRSLFVALAKDDDAAVVRLTAPSFYAFEGERISAAELSALIRKAHQAGRVYRWNIGAIDAHVDCNMAWAAWENVGAAGTPPALEPRRWLESAALVRENGRWLIQFMHSTPVKP